MNEKGAEHAGNVVSIGEIRLQRIGLASDRCNGSDRLCGSRRIGVIVNNDIGAGFCQADCNTATDIAAATGH